MPSVQDSDAETPSLESDINHARSNGGNGVNGAHKTNGANGLPPWRIRCIIIGAGCVKILISSHIGLYCMLIYVLHIKVFQGYSWVCNTFWP